MTENLIIYNQNDLCASLGFSEHLCVIAIAQSNTKTTQSFTEKTMGFY